MVTGVGPYHTHALLRALPPPQPHARTYKSIGHGSPSGRQPTSYTRVLQGTRGCPRTDRTCLDQSKVRQSSQGIIVSINSSEEVSTRHQGARRGACSSSTRYAQRSVPRGLLMHQLCASVPHCCKRTRTPTSFARPPPRQCACRTRWSRSMQTPSPPNPTHMLTYGWKPPMALAQQPLTQVAHVASAVPAAGPR